MAEIFGIISSTLTIGDVVCKLRECRKRMKAAPALWEKYCDKLERLAHAQSVLLDIQSCQDHVINEAKSRELASLAAEEIEIIKKQAGNILGAYDKLVSSERKRIWDWFRVKRGTLKFVVTEQHLEGLIDSAQKAKMSLQSAICLMQLEALNSGQMQTQHAFQIIHDSMREHAEALKRINRDNKLSRMAFAFSDEKGKPVKCPKGKRKDPNDPNSKSKHSSRRSTKTKASSKSQQSQTKKSSRAQDAFQVKEQNCDPSKGHELVLRNNEVLVMATDADEFNSAASGNRTEGQITRLNRFERVLESISDDEWGQGMGSHLHELQPSLTSTSSLTLASTSSSLDDLDADVNNNVTPIRMDAEKLNHAFVGRATNLFECVNGQKESMLFCVSYICITETSQTFTMQEPCRRGCDHVTLQIMNTRSIKKKLPYLMTFESISCEVFSGERDEIQPAPDITLQSFHRCQDRKPCSHTLVEGGLPENDAQTPQTVVCVCSDNLEAWLDDFGWESHTPTERTADDVPDGPAQDGDESALVLLQDIMRKDHDNDFHIPDQIPFGVLVGFLKLIERLDLEGEYLEQCHVWTNAILSEVSNSFDTDAIAWAWVLWKLQIAPEFKRLSSMIQRCFMNGQSGGNTDFEGVSFADAAGWIRSMMDLGDFVVGTVPPASKMPFFLAGLASFVPVVGVLLHEVRISACLSSKVYEDLNGMIRRLEEEEDWGIDLLHHEF
ncbi:hypothetical protein HG530_013886 [Fusarium avenaceum]|nr:hypothetical protein HG530_013886 [Fusarium avenaceum]